MVKVTERDPLATPKHILKKYKIVEARIAKNPESWRKLSFEAHKKLCNILRGNSFDYLEFEFWFSRFARGEFDLDYDRSSDPKARSLTDLPWDTFEKVGEYLDFDDKLVLRNVCKDIRAHVDNWDPKVTKFWYRSANDWEFVLKSKQCGDYSCTESWSPAGIQNTYESEEIGTERYRDNRFRAGFYRDKMSFVMSVLAHPKVQLEELEIREEDDDWKKLIRELDRSNRKLHVKKVEFPSLSSSKIDLHFMIPGVLEEIELFPIFPTAGEMFAYIKSEQCQAAKMVYIESWTETSRFPLDTLYSCPRFTLKLSGEAADGRKANFLKTLMEYGKVQKCVLNISRSRSPQSEVLKYFNEPEAMVTNFPSFRRYPIPETDDFYELEYNEEVKYREEVRATEYEFEGDYREVVEHRTEFVRLERKQFERDPLAIRRRILEEFEKVQTEITTNPESWRKLSFEGYKELCKELGAKFMDYPEFESWFAKFLQGNFDLDCDRRSDPKAPSLTDLPFDIFEKIGGSLELEDKFQLRNVCKHIRAQVDNWDPKVTEIYLTDANDWKVWQTSRPEPYCADNFGQNENNRSSSGFYRNPISFVMNILKHPKLRLEKLTIDQQGKFWKKLDKRLEASNRKLHVRNVEFPYIHSSKVDLHFLVPGVLEEIQLFLMNPTREEIFKIVKSEQCQSAKMVYIESPTITSNFPLDALYGCPRFTLRLKGRPADGLKANFLKTLRKKGEVQKCVIYAESQIMKYFNQPEAMVPNFPSLRRYPIRGTNDFYEIEYQGESVRLERKP